jgi:hypothetical protein
VLFFALVSKDDKNRAMLKKCDTLSTQGVVFCKIDNTVKFTWILSGPGKSLDLAI